MSKASAFVPCNGCTACCQNELLILHPEEGDRIEDYQFQAVSHPFTGEMVFALKTKPNGDCVYLGIGGCTIHGRAPAICRSFDCRRLVAALGGRPGQRRALASERITKDVLDAGRARLATLPKEPRSPA